MTTPIRHTIAGLQPQPAPAPRTGTFRASLDAEPLPSQRIAAPSLRGSRWGKGPLVEGQSAQRGVEPKQQRVRRPR